MPGRTAELRPSTKKELNATTLLWLPIETFSIKTRSGPPGDIASDLDAPVWAGVVPITSRFEEPYAAADLTSGADTPAGFAALAGRDTDDRP